ncbi:MAG: hypothetical protein AAGI38_13945 [Bacteroidota bacterium]
MKKGAPVGKDENLLRRVYKKDKRYRDPKTGRPTSRAFVPRPKDNGKLSVDIEKLTTPERAVLDPHKFLLYRFSCKIVYALGLTCTYDPIDTGQYTNHAYALITGFDKNDESVPAILARKAKQV